MKKVLFVLGMMISILGISQTPIINWSKNYGGSMQDVVHSIKKTKDNGFIMVGETQSNDSDVIGFHVSSSTNYRADFWVLKLDSLGKKLWQKTLGGTGLDIAYSVLETNDSNYMVAGFTNSVDGNVTSSYGQGDCWIVKLSKQGSIIWQKNYGGTASEFIQDIIETNDGGLLFFSQTTSNDLDVTGNNGSYDNWVCKLDDLGNISWQKCFGGTNYEYPSKIKKTLDNGYLLIGYSMSKDSGVINNYGFSDYWIVKIDSIGNTIWQKNYGGSKEDFAYDAICTSDNGFIIVGESLSNDFDITNNYGNGDIWLIKINSSGDLQWQKNYGGDQWDMGYTIVQANVNEYLICGRTVTSNNGDVNYNHGGYDNWVISIDTLGVLNWGKCFGGSSHELGGYIVYNSNNNFVFASSSNSNNGDVHSHYGTNSGFPDFWIVNCTIQPLPLKLLSFTTKLQTQNKVNINWQTANEVNVAHINIQRSLNGKEFNTIGKVVARCCEYSYNDLLTISNLLLPTIFYRLEIIDKDGSKTYSEIRDVELGMRNNGISIYPNPVKGMVSIDCAGAKELLIVDYLGRVIKKSVVSESASQSSAQLSIINCQLQKGIYIVKATLTNGDIKTEKLVVE